ncbi:hypothetical protein [Mammaliicoccus sciuri]|uniref:hypothetical protein n=1 Tax=Mammaliicoccus sciuri TaxID=1296 RepID=UPI001A97F83A|nr:hypothetical protein [Mammaliicoccus sciuri]MBO1209255.1 hypothetical protein [Mammaliicoccus sciuri]
MSSIILKDIDFKENNILLSLEHIKSITVDDIKYNFFKMMITYENTCIEKEILLFEDDIQNLKLSNFTNKSPDYFFNEPDFWFTIIQLNQTDLVLYINFDSGLNHMNMATESGFSVRIVTKESFNIFIYKLKSFI